MGILGSQMAMNMASKMEATMCRGSSLRVFEDILQQRRTKWRNTWNMK